MIQNIIVAVLFLALGVVIKYGKMYNLLAGYNTMSKEEKERYNIEKAANLFFNVFGFMAALVLIFAILSGYLEMPEMANWGLGLALVLGIPYLLIKANSKAYYKN